MRLRAIALVSVAALVLAACGGAGSNSTETGAPVAPPDGDATGMLKAVLDAGVIRVATDPAYPPQSELNPKTGEYEGFDIDVAEEIASRLGVEVEWVTPSWDLLTAGGWNDRWEMSVGSMTPLPERQEVLYFTPGYYFTPVSALVNEDNTTITDTESGLDGKTIGVCGGCTYEYFLDQSLVLPGEDLNFVIDDPSVKTYDTDSTAIQDLALGDGDRLDAVLTSSTTAQSAVEKGKSVKIVGDPLFLEPLSIAFDKSASEDPMPLVDAVSAIVEEMHADGTLSELSMQWFGEDLTTAPEGM